MKRPIYPDITAACYSVVDLSTRYDEKQNFCKYQIAEYGDDKYLLFVDLYKRETKQPEMRFIYTLHSIVDARNILRVNYRHYKYETAGCELFDAMSRNLDRRY